MIALIEGAKRQKTPNEIALSILLSGLTLIFLIAVVTLWGLAGYSRHGALGHRARRAAGHADPDDDRRPAVGHRHRRHGPAGPLQRHRHLRPRRRGGGRRRYAAARQDRHHHLRQPHGDRVPAGARRHASRSSPKPRCWPASPTRRRKAARSWRWPAASSASSAHGQDAGRRRALRRRDAPLGRRHRRPQHPQGRGRCGAQIRRHRPTQPAPPEFRQAVETVARTGGTPLAVAERRQAARRHPSQGRGEAGHQGALRRAARHGHPHRHGDRRQPGDGGGDRLGSRRRRLSSPRPRRSRSSTTSATSRRAAG